MNCSNVASRLDDYLDGRLDVRDEESMQRHLEACPGCRRALERTLALAVALRSLPAPAPRPGFLEEALSRAAARRASRWPLPALALAATLVLGLALGALLASRADDQAVHLALEQPQTVRLVFHSAQPLAGATLSLSVPPNVEIVGYGGRRELTWRTELRQGANYLRLPLVARGRASGELMATLSHGEATRIFRLKIEVKPAGDTS